MTTAKEPRPKPEPKPAPAPLVDQYRAIGPAALVAALMCQPCNRQKVAVRKAA